MKRPINWPQSFRIIPSIFPPIALFETVADPRDLEAVYQIEALTNDRLRQEIGQLHLVPVSDRVSGPGTTPIMAAFTHFPSQGDRFTDGTYGAYYAANNLDTAVAETVHHRQIFLAATQEPAKEIDMRVYLANISADLDDISERARELNDIYDPDNYQQSQRYARTLKNNECDGILFQSVRDPSGLCVAIFKPRLISNCRQERHLCYKWDGQKIFEIYEKALYSGGNVSR